MPPKKRFLTCEICGDRAERIDCEKRKFMAKFPLDEARCRQWVKFVGKEDLIYVPIEKLHSLKYVCGAHFENKDFNKNKNRLNKYAVPSVNLSADPLPGEKLREFPCHISSYTETDYDEASISPIEPISGPSDMDELEHQSSDPEFSKKKKMQSKRKVADKLIPDNPHSEHDYCIKKKRVLPKLHDVKK